MNPAAEVLHLFDSPVRAICNVITDWWTCLRDGHTPFRRYNHDPIVCVRCGKRLG